MSQYTEKKWAIALAACMVASLSPMAQATSCMVLGEATARVLSAEGEKSPVFLTAACESLRLVSGKAMVSWVSRDGKPHFSPIGKNGAESLPTAGAEERSANVVWAELTSKREVDRPAFMRALNEERPARVYVPVDGLLLAAKPDADFQIIAVDGDKETLIYDKKATDTGRILLSRAQILPGKIYVVAWHNGAVVERLRWQTIDATETARVDSEFDLIRATVTDDAQRRIMIGMLFEQLKLRVNMAATLSNS